MAALPSPTQVAGSHAAIYEAYYNQVDPRGYGRIGALEAARFLKKSQLSDVVLSRIWDLADPQSRGSLDKTGMFVALKLCAFAQSDRELNIANLSQDVAPPKMGELPKITQRPQPVAPPVITSVSNGDWSIKPNERAKYDQLFDSLQPSNGYIPGNKVKGVLMDSKLPLDTLGKIWDLADMDKDGMLDRHEFVVAMHLVYKALEKYAIPSVLPPELMPPGKRKPASPMIVGKPPSSQIPVAMAAPPPIPPLPNATSAVNSLVGLEPVKVVPVVQQWVVSAEDQAAADKLFLQADMDMDGFVSGSEIKDVFLQSGLQQGVLAHIWGLCDLCQSGKLNKEQFALSMWLIKQKLRGIDPPTSLTPEMMPPSLRKNTEPVVENNNITGYSNPELDMISKDIADLARERRAMEQDIAQKEADIKIKNGEIKSLQSELDTLAATLKQLENQRGEAQKRLNDLKAQRADVDRELSEVERETREEQDKVDKLRQQAEEQETVLRTQEDELNTKRQELEGLRQEEQQLEQQQNNSREQLNELTKNLQNTQLQISQAKAKITHLEEQQRQMSDAIAIYDSALAAGDPSLVPDNSLQFNPEIEDIDHEEHSMARVNGTTAVVAADAFANGSSFGPRDDPFASSEARDAFGSVVPQVDDPFASAFDSQPAAVRPSTNATGVFARDPFAFASTDPGHNKQDPFDPFGDGKRNAGGPTQDGASATKDPFGEDPFANLHAPTRAESPSPALPPKKAKQPPPRPAPPRPASAPGSGPGPLRAAPAPPTPSPTPDPFANANTDPFAAQQSAIDNNNGNTFVSEGTTGFADFANFDSKPELLVCRTTSRTVNNNAGQSITGSSTLPSLPVKHSSGSAISILSTSKLPDFTEDPFRDYRYEDPFNIVDPFAEDTTENARNANLAPDNTEKNDNLRQNLDPFGFAKTTSAKKNFEADFTNTFSRRERIARNNRENDVKTKFDDYFDDNATNANDNSINTTGDDAFRVRNEKIVDFDEIFDRKSENVSRKNDFAQAFKDKLNFGEKRGKNNANDIWKNGKTASGGGTVSGKTRSTAMFATTEEQQLAWASEESLRAEAERRRIAEKEDADLAFVIELSKHENSGKF